MAKGKKIILTPEQEEWLKNNFPNTTNAKLAEHLDISEASIHRFARKFGLTKSAEFWERNKQKAAEGTRKWFRVHGSNLSPGWIIPGSEKHRFKKGETSVQR